MVAKWGCRGQGRNGGGSGGQGEDDVLPNQPTMMKTTSDEPIKENIEEINIVGEP